jgi:autotransporter adhesin
VSIESSVALGYESKATVKPTGTSEMTIPGTDVVYTNIAGKKPVGTVSVGDTGKERTITNVAAGKVTADSTEAINGSQLYAILESGVPGGGGGDEIDTDNRVVGLRKVDSKQKIISPFIEIQGVKDATADANENSEYAQADAERAIAIGYKSDAQGTDSIALGSGAEAYGEQTIAIGHNAKAGDAGDSSKAKGAVAISANSQSTGEYSVAMQGSKATGDYSIAYGKDSQANTENSLAALGGTVKEDGKGSAAIGEGAQATVAGTVALGKGSIADQKSGKDQGNSGYDVLLDGESEEDDYIWRSTENAIAVGSVNGKITRRIIGVAAGHDDTDAVNVAQLKKVAEALKDSGGGSGSGSWNLAVNDKDPDPVKNDNTVRLNVNQPEGTELLNLTDEVNDNGERVVTWVVSDSPKFDSLTVGTKGGTFTSKGPAVFEGPVTMKENLNMSGKQIKNLGWATEDDDAVPLGQLKDYVNNTGNNFNYINNKIDKGLRHVGSRAAALAALHPLDYDPDKPTSIMAGFGHYKGDSTVALGVAHHFNDDTLVTVGSTIGHDTMVNVGLSLRLGRNTNMTEKRWKVQRYTAVDYDAKLKVMEAKYRDLKEDKDAEISALRRELQSLREDMRTLRGTKGTRK